MAHGCWVYLLASKKRGTLYVGVTNDLGRRVFEHQQGVVAGFTRQYGVKLLVHAEHYESIAEARQREHSIKRWRRAWKISLIEEQNPEWRDLANDTNV